MERVILHADLNGFYASVACLLQPELHDRAVVVAGDPEARHGIILAKSERAKAYGIKTGDAIWQAQQKCPDLVIVKPDYAQYKRFSELARQIYLEYTPQVEPFGIDEAWLDVTHRGDITVGARVAEELRVRMREELGLTLSIGVSFNKIFAKLGSDYKKPDAVTVFSKENYQQLIFPLPVQDLLYVGRATAKKLHGSYIHTIGDLAQTDRTYLIKKLGKMGHTLHAFANGLDDSPVAYYHAKQLPKSVGNSATTPHDLINEDGVCALLWALCDSVARRLREQRLCARTVTLSVRNRELQTFTRQKKLEDPTCLARDLYDGALSLFRASYQWQTPVRSIGVQAGDLERENQVGVQLDFDGHALRRQRCHQLEHTVDFMQARFGSHAIRRGAQMLDQDTHHLIKNDSFLDPR